MNHKSFVSCKLHSLLGFFLMLHFMEAAGVTGKAAKEGSKFIPKAVRRKVSFPDKISENKATFGSYCHTSPLVSCSFSYDLLNSFLKYAGSITYTVLVELKQNQNKQL